MYKLIQVVNQLFPLYYLQLLFTNTLKCKNGKVSNKRVFIVNRILIMNKICGDFRHVLSHLQLIQFAIFSFIYPYYGLSEYRFPHSARWHYFLVFSMLMATQFSSVMKDISQIHFSSSFFHLKVFQITVVKILTKFIRIKC